MSKFEKIAIALLAAIAVEGAVTTAEVVRMADGPESYCEIKMFAKWVIDECVEILREVAAYWDFESKKNKKEE